MERGFNLILIERDGDSIQNLEAQLRELLPDKNPHIIKIVLNKFDQDSISHAVGDTSTCPVKIFVNCKTSKKTASTRVDEKELAARKAAILKDSLATNDP